MKTIEVCIKDFLASIPRRGNLYCVIDVGATNCRVGLVSVLEASQTIPFLKQKASSLAQLKNILRSVAESLGENVCMRIAGAAIDVPGPVEAGRSACLSNYGDSPEGEIIRITDLSASLCPRGKTVMLNDLAAAAYGVLGLRSCGVVHEFFEPLFSHSKQSAVTSTHTLIVTPGTGLGSALLLWNDMTGKHTVLPLEFGHSEFAAKEDSDFLDKYRKEIKRFPVPDDLCSGRGLVKMHQYIVGSADANDASAICQSAMEGKAEALAALRLYFKFLMNYCGNVAMGLQAFNILLCGDNIVKNDFFLSSTTEAIVMRRELLKNGSERMGMMSKITVSRQSRYLNLHIVGCAHAAAQLSAIQSNL